MTEPLGFGREISMQDYGRLRETTQRRASNGHSVPVGKLQSGYNGQKVVIDGKEWRAVEGVDYTQFNFSQRGNFWYDSKNHSDYIYVLEAQDDCCSCIIL